MEHPATIAAISAVVDAYDTALAAKDALVTELRTSLSDARMEVAAQRIAAETAEQAARVAEERAERLEAADAARRARGRWARLKAAWRGQ